MPRSGTNNTLPVAVPGTGLTTDVNAMVRRESVKLS